MPFAPQEKAEPIPGYCLLKRLGSGGYGEVWKCTAPGGLSKAIKFIYGQMQESRAEQELKALNRIKEVRHPFLLSLERFEIIDGHLFIITELADMSLLDRFQQCQAAKMPGIPREELLEYIRDAADVLDYLRENHGLQHLDIKPQNLLLVAGRIKIADFGLVKELNASSVTATGGVTPVYAPPESFDGRVTMFSDQYSLAIVYQEMLTGSRPFPGTTTLQLATQHSHSPPMLDSLPVQDRAIIGRALAKVPEQRYPTCKKLAQDLLQSHLNPGAVDESADEFAMVEQAAHAFRPSSTQEREHALAMDTEANIRLPKFGSTTPPRLLPAGAECQTPLRPMLFLGIGGLAGAAMRRLKRRLVERYSDLATVPTFGFLLLDTDRKAIQEALQGPPEERLAPEETLYLPLHPPEHYRERAKDLLNWLDRRWLYGIPRSMLTEGFRPLGRLALVENVGAVLERLREILPALSSEKALALTQQTTGLTVREKAPRVVVLASLGGGSGSGMFLDLAFAVRQVLLEANLPVEDTTGLLLYGEGQRPATRDLSRMNACAALQELHHYSQADVAYPGDPDNDLRGFTAGIAPFQHCYLVHLGDKLGEADADAATDTIAEYLYLDSATPASGFLEQNRKKTLSRPAPSAHDTLVRTFGLARIHFPKSKLARRAADLLCLRAVEGWLGEKSEGKSEMDLPHLACERDLEIEALAEKLRAAVEGAWGKKPEHFLRQLLMETPVQGGAMDAVAKGPMPRQKIDAAFATETPEQGVASQFQLALMQQGAALENQLGGFVTQWLTAIVETPGKRFKAAERASRWLRQKLITLTDFVRAQESKFRSQKDTRSMQIMGQSSVAKGSGVRWLGFRRQNPSGDDAQLALVNYGLGLLELRISEKSLKILESLGHRLREWDHQASQCRQRLHHFADSLRSIVSGRTAPPSQWPGPANHVELFPGSADTLEQAAGGVFQSLAPEAVQAMEEKLQSEYLNPQGGLWSLLSAGSDFSAELQENLEAYGVEAVLEALHNVDAASLFLDLRSDDGQTSRDLRVQVKAAIPRLEVPKEVRRLFIGVPPSPGGARLANLAFEAIRDQPVVVVGTDGDVVLIQEAAPLSLKKVAASWLEGRTGLDDAQRRLATRGDIAWSSLWSETMSEQPE